MLGKHIFPASRLVGNNIMITIDFLLEDFFSEQSTKCIRAGCYGQKRQWLYKK
jgi:hypothetical protein